MNRGHCEICGQELTDASGSWKVIFHYTGCMGDEDKKFKCCSYCQDMIQDAIFEVQDRRNEERRNK